MRNELGFNMVQQHFDIAIIGAGPGGYSTALRAAELGKSVALIERDGTLGGTCLNRGCIPSKALLTAVHSVETIHNAERMGINATLQSIDFGRLRDFRVSTVETMTKGLTGLLAHRGVTVFRGCAALQNAHTVRVTPAEGRRRYRGPWKPACSNRLKRNLRSIPTTSCWQPDRVRLRCLEIRSPAR